MTDKEAIRDGNGNTVFVKQSGEYSYTFPEENIVNVNPEGNEFKVYFFIPDENGKFGYREFSALFKDKQRSLSFASEIYGENLSIGNLSGEIFEIEVHRV